MSTGPSSFVTVKLPTSQSLPRCWGCWGVICLELETKEKVKLEHLFGDPPTHFPPTLASFLLGLWA